MSFLWSLGISILWFLGILILCFLGIAQLALLAVQLLSLNVQSQKLVAIIDRCKYIAAFFRAVLLTWTAFVFYIGITFGFLFLGYRAETRKYDNQRARITASVDTILHKHQPHYLFEEGTVFSLLFEQNGNPENMDGICPVNANATWLKAFRTALRECTGEEGLKLEVSGLASTFPGHDDDSNKLNLKIANLRTVSTAALLLADSTPDAINDSTLDATNDDCLCGSSFSDRSVADTLAAHCEAAKDSAMDRPHHFTELPSDRPFVRYKLWTTFEQMHYNTQANDEQVNDEQTSPDSGNHSVLAFLNRSVRITMLNDACRY